MKTKIFQILLLFGLLVWNTGCVKDVTPSDAINTESLASTKDGLLNVTNGCYALFKDNIEFNGFVDMNNNYLRQYFQLCDFASDDITCGQVTEDPLFYSFTLTHSPDQANTRFFWYVSYKIINSTNTVIEIADKMPNKDAGVNQLLGENYFLRAFCHFNLLKFYAKPYTIDPNAPGIIIRSSTSESSQKARATVKECYDFIISDLQKAAKLMNQSRGVQYASKEAAWAFLSRVYLYMDDEPNTIAYADSVINSNKFQLETAEGYKTYFPQAASSTESIFLVAFTQADNKGKFGSIASMLYSDGNSGWGEEFASSSLRDAMSAHPEDVRWAYIDSLKDGNGGIVKKNGIETFYIKKFSYQDGDPNLSSPVMFRLAEMYLNRAEAYAKQGNDALALADVDMIRQNRGLENSLYNGVVPQGLTALQVVLNERRIELAFEGHRTIDVYRNKLSMDRSYWGYHLRGLKESDINLATKPQGYANEIVDYTNPRIIYYIPVDEKLANPLCVQNP
ncbi:MAG TPA: RagB/SusD family nutrient uptake outer membrane protein [Bacteroidales bacterium]|nr:RagB/SusD family nutrient uptake outer membrane protein [Bacteroidales bacterium]